jgi:hypothetical protein
MFGVNSAAVAVTLADGTADGFSNRGADRLGLRLGRCAMTRRSMLHAALAYVEAGWPIVPGATPYGSSACRRIRLVGPSGPVWLECSCDSRYCMTPAAHPIDPHWQHHQITTPADARWWWSARSGMLPNIVLVCGPAFHVWSIPRAVGARVLDALPEKIAAAVPVAATTLGWWHLFCAPQAAPEELPPVPTGVDVVHLGDSKTVAAPPSTRGALGHDMWLREPTTRQRLVPCALVAAAVQHATHQVEAARAQRGARGVEQLRRVRRLTGTGPGEVVLGIGRRLDGAGLPSSRRPARVPVPACGAGRSAGTPVSGGAG